jgi:hypothetical protein
MPDLSQLVGSAVLVVMGLVFHCLQEEIPVGTILYRYLAEKPSLKNRQRHIKVALGLIATVVVGLGPLGYAMLDGHPCWAWSWWVLSFFFSAYSFWSIVPLRRWVRLVTLLGVLAIFGFYGRQSLIAHTELDVPFLNPGVLFTQGTGIWHFMVTSQNTHRSLFNVDLLVEDRATARALNNVSDVNKRAALTQRMVFRAHYLELSPTSWGEGIDWQPLDVNDQEYNARITYRAGDKDCLATEDIRMVNVGERFVSGNQTAPRMDFQLSVTLRNQAGEILMHCVDPRLPHDANWIPGHPCFPGANYAPFPRSLCTRCFGRGFEFYPQK